MLAMIAAGGRSPAAAIRIAIRIHTEKQMTSANARGCHSRDGGVSDAAALEIEAVFLDGREVGGAR